MTRFHRIAPRILATLLLAQVVFAQAGTGEVSGRLLGPDGLPAPGVRVAVAAVDEQGRITPDNLMGIAMTDQDGMYRIGNLPPGRYGIVAGAITAQSTFFPGTADRSEAGMIRVTDQAAVGIATFKLVTLLPLSSTPPVRISGRLVSDSGPIPPEVLREFKLSFSGTILVPAQVSELTLAGNIIGAQRSINGTFEAQPDGTFQLSLLSEGKFSFKAERPPLFRPDNDYYLKGVALGPISYTFSAIPIARDEKQELRLTFGRGAQIRGHVQTKSGAAASNVQVYLMSSSVSPLTVSQRMDALRTAITDEQGNFILRAVPPDSYRLYCDAQGQEADAAAIQVGGDSPPPMNMMLIDGPPARHLVLAPTR